MAAYAALLSLKYIIEQVQHHPRPPISLDQNQVQSLLENINFSQDFLEVYSHIRNKEADGLQSRIAEAAYEAEDVIESHIVDQILAQSTTHGEKISSVDFYQGVQKVIEDMNIIKKEVMEIKEKMGSVGDIQQHITRSIPAAASLGSSSAEKNAMVGFDDVLEEIMDKLTRWESNRQIILITGMGGIGKTTLAKNVYENPLIVQRFDMRGWATISRDYTVKEILLQLIGQDSLQSSGQTSEEELRERLYKSLCGKRYLIVMDDLWSIEAWDEIRLLFPYNKNGSGIIITSRLSNIVSYISGACEIKMSYLNEDKSWNLLCKTVFKGHGCPVELEKTGKEIANKCEGLPLSIVVIGGLLAKSEQSGEYWKYIAKNLNSIVNLEDNERCLNLLYMSYNYLPVHLKPCFLYMGVFSEDEKIRVLELVKLWVAEGLLKPISGKSLEEVARDYLNGLVDRNLILVDKWTRNGEIKLCKMHDLLRDLCLREAEKDKFLHVTRVQSLNNFPQDINIQRRIAIHRGSLWEENDEYYLPEIHDALQSAPYARSLIYVSMKILACPNLRLSRILKVFDKRGEENRSIESLFQLVNLRYLDVAAHWIYFDLRTIPSSVYLLWNLQTLIVDHVPTTNVDIWKLPLLRHVKLMSLFLDGPLQDDFILGNLQTLSKIGNFICGDEVVKRIPNIKKLNFYYNSDAILCSASHYCLNNLGRLHKLESLDFCFPWSDSVQNLTFPHSLKKLTLSDSSLHWGDMLTKIGSLPHLQVLILVKNSSSILEWETIDGQFPRLKFLEIHAQKLECWTTEASHFPCLEHLFLKHLWSLKEIPSDLGNISTLKVIEIDDCSNAAVVSAKEITEEKDELGNKDLQVRVYEAHSMPYTKLKKMASHNFLVGWD